MKKLSPKVIIFIGLAVGFFLIIYYQMSRSSLFGSQLDSKAPSAPISVKAGGKTPIKYDVPALRIDLLSHASAAYDPAGRNLFNYDKPKPTAAELEEIRKQQEIAQKRAQEEQKRMMEEAKRQAEIAQQEAATRANLPPPPPPAPQVNFKYLGYIGNIEDKIAVLEEGEDCYFAKQGETVKDDFLIIKIDFDAVIVGYNRPEWQDQSRVLPLGK